MKKVYLSILLIVLLSNMISASITISKPESIYSLGDTIYTTIIINPSRVEGNFDFKLVCGNASETFYRISPAKSAFTPNQEIRINHRISLEKEYLGSLKGECSLLASIGGITAQTEKFRISSDITVTADFDKDYYNPGETIILNIDAIKANGERLNGFVRGEGIFQFEKQIIEGKARESFVTKNNLEAGEYSLSLFVFDENENKEILNSDNSSIRFRINQVPYSVPLSLVSLEVNPGETFELRADIFDQSGKKMEGIVVVELVSPLRERIQLTLKSGNTSSVRLSENASAGNWIISSSHGQIKEERTIRVNSIPRLNFTFLEGSSVLVIRNIGNADFTGDVIINISEEQRNLSLNIKTGEERMFTLSAPTGEHNIRIGSGDNLLEKRLLLTGRAIDIQAYGRFPALFEYRSVWLIIATILILLLIVVFFRYTKKNFRLDKKSKTRFENFRVGKNNFLEKKLFEEDKKPFSNSAESALIIKGMREPSTVVTLKIKNELNPLTRENIKNICLELNQKTNAAIDIKEREVFTIFSPRKTKTYKNEYVAIKFAMELNKALQEYNKKFKDKIAYGIGVSSGDLISTMDGSKLKYAGVDNTISLSKKISDISDQEVILSDRVKNKLVREVKTNKIEKAGHVYHQVLRISEKEDNQEKLKDLLKRTNLKKEEKF